MPPKWPLRNREKKFIYKAMVSRRTTLQDIAKVCGCSTMAVSLALRNHTSVSAKRRAKICAVAKKMGYSPDPTLSALAAYRRIHYPKPTATPIAWISNYPTANVWNQPHHFVNDYFLGATRRAREIGYHLEHFWLREPGMSPQRLSQVLYTRGVSGLLFTPQHASSSHLSFAHLNMDWDKFCAVTFGYSLTHPRLHMTTTNHYRSMGMVLRKVRSFGYRRIGLLLNSVQDKRIMHNHHAAFLIDQLRVPAKLKVPVHLISDNSVKARAAKNKWYRTHRPEVIISTADGAELQEIVADENLRCPEDVGLVALSTAAGRSDKSTRILSGADESHEDVGLAATDLLVTLMNHNERGVPSTPRSVLIDSKWVPGTTLRRINTK
jgi:LacI family transcriptional regulator